MFFYWSCWDINGAAWQTVLPFLTNVLKAWMSQLSKSISTSCKKTCLTLNKVHPSETMQLTLRTSLWFLPICLNYSHILISRSIDIVTAGIRGKHYGWQFSELNHSVALNSELNSRNHCLTSFNRCFVMFTEKLLNTVIPYLLVTSTALN